MLDNFFIQVDSFFQIILCRTGKTSTLSSDGTVADEVSTRVGLRTFSVDSKKGFFLNGRPYPLHGVSRHQDRKGVGNAITREMHDEDMALIRELGANTVRLAHYQHDQYFYDLCDQYGMVVWAEIPYISEHLPNGRILLQMLLQFGDGRIVIHTHFAMTFRT